MHLCMHIQVSAGWRGGEELARMLRRNSSLTHLDLRSNKIGDRASSDVRICTCMYVCMCICMALMLRRNSSLTHLDLQSNTIGGRASSDVCICTCMYACVYACVYVRRASLDESLLQHILTCNPIRLEAERRQMCVSVHVCMYVHTHQMHVSVYMYVYVTYLRICMSLYV